MTGEGGFWDDAEVIHAYTREDAIRDGVLVPVAVLVPDEPNFAQSAGFAVPVALTARVAALVRPTEAEADYGQDLEGRLWDLLNMARLARPRPLYEENSTWRFRCIFYVARDDYQRRGSRTLVLKASIHPGDEGELVATFMFPDED